MWPKFSLATRGLNPIRPYFYHTAAVLYAADGCDHLNCHGSPFLVVIIGAYGEDDFRWVNVYSSATGVWTTSSSIQLEAYIEERPSLLAGDALYFNVQQGQSTTWRGGACS
ncbi:hypothetical protein U9M48_043983 [Paspalum notatum var. saurae]|uniref:Uncharacterized protein n=1 Tax=Paspalum notatum var. saurae TaxID=547442 RepID=A0AAQ3UVR7_PASNO